MRVGFIGIGSRGLAAVHRFLSIPGVEIKALCDLESENLDKARALLVHAKFPAAQEYSSKNGYKEICERQDIDLIYICTDWLNHTQLQFMQWSMVSIRLLKYLPRLLWNNVGS